MFCTTQGNRTPLDPGNLARLGQAGSVPQKQQASIREARQQARREFPKNQGL